MPWRLVLTCFSLIEMQGPAMGHQIGLAEQVLQPVTVLHSLLALIAVGLLCRQQPKLVLNRAVALALGLGLTAGLAAEVYLTVPHGRLIFALALAALAGGLVAFAHPLPVYATFVFVLALGGAIGANLSSGIGRLGRSDPNAGGGVPGDPRRVAFPYDGWNSVHRQFADRRARYRFMDFGERHHGPGVGRSQSYCWLAAGVARSVAPD